MFLCTSKVHSDRKIPHDGESTEKRKGEAGRKREMGMKDGREKTRDRDKAPLTRF